MCICVDCHWVDCCQAYHAVERQHGAEHLCVAPSFVPQSPRIHVSVIALGDAQAGVEWDVRACDSFEAEPGRWLLLRPGQAQPT